MKKGFTLLELLIVIIIVGIMATLGLTQYMATVERSRGAEARQILGQLRSVCAALYLDGNDVLACSANSGVNLSLGTGAANTIPSTQCASSHFFKYTVAKTNADTLQITATRCGTASAPAGKSPGYGTENRYLNMTVDYAAGTANWTSPNGY